MGCRDGIGSDLCDGGEFYLWSEGLVRSQDPCYVWLGYEFELSLSEKALTKHLYAGVGIGSSRQKLFASGSSLRKNLTFAGFSSAML